jgi:phospholipid N-methyltransferase
MLFAKNFFRHPKMLGSIIPSSRFLTARLLRSVDWPRAKVVVEYGPGVGTFTSEILRRLPEDGRIIAIEMNREFAAYVRKSLRDPRLEVVTGSAAEVESVLAKRGIEKADYVISGIPFSTIPEEVREQILQHTRSVLDPAGAFLLYQFSPKVLPDLRRIFSHVSTSFEPLNVLPAQVFHCTP